VHAVSGAAYVRDGLYATAYLVSNDKLRSRRACTEAGGVGLSTTVAIDAIHGDQCLLQPGGREVIDNYPCYRLEYLELMARIVGGPECDDGLERGATGQAAGDLGDENRRILTELEPLPRPPLHPLERSNMIGQLVTGAQHGDGWLTFT